MNEALFVKNLILEVDFARRAQIVAYTDSTAGKSMATRFGAGKRAKHVELRYLYVQNLVQSGLLQARKIGTNWIRLTKSARCDWVPLPIA